MGEVDQATSQQYLRSVIIHSLDHFNFVNAEFAAERLLCVDPNDLDSIYLYGLALYRQEKIKSCHNILASLLLSQHVGCSYLYGLCCLKLETYKEGVFHLTRVCSPHTDPSRQLSAGQITSPVQYSTAEHRFSYEFHRTIMPDAASIYHLLGDLYKGLGDVKKSSLNFSLCLQLNPFDFAAFQKVSKMGVNVNVKALYKPGKDNNVIIGNDLVTGQSAERNNGKGKQVPDSALASPSPHLSNFPKQEGLANNILVTPRVKPILIPDAPLRRTSNNTTNTKVSSLEFTKPPFPTDQLDRNPKRESGYSRITSRLVSQPGGNKSSDSFYPSVPNPMTRSGMKRNSSIFVSSPINDRSLNSSESFPTKDIQECNDQMAQLYMIFAKGFKLTCTYNCYKAIRILESLPEREKETPWVLSKLGRLHYEINNYKQSEYFYSKLRKLDRARLEDMEYYSTLLWHLQRKVELTFLANELRDIDSKSPVTWCVIGNLFSLLRVPDEAIKCFNRSIKLDSKFTYGYTLRGHEYFGSDNYEMALESFRHSLLLDPRHYNAIYGIGMIYINLGEYQKADYHFRKAISINPVNIILICCVGMVMEKSGKKMLALKQYELAHKLQPLNPLPLFKQAQLLFSMQQFREALKHFETLRDLAPDEASVHFLLGQLYNIQNNKYQAIKEFTIALNLDPKGNYLIREAMELLKQV